MKNNSIAARIAALAASLNFEARSVAMINAELAKNPAAAEEIYSKLRRLVAIRASYRR